MVILIDGTFILIKTFELKGFDVKTRVKSFKQTFRMQSSSKINQN